MDHNEIGTRGTAKDCATTKLLCTNVVIIFRELAPNNWALLLVVEHKVSRFKLVELLYAILALDESRPGARSEFLLSKLTGRIFVRMHSCVPHLDAQFTKGDALSNPLSVFPPEMDPLGVPTEEAFLEGHQV